MSAAVMATRTTVSALAAVALKDASPTIAAKAIPGDFFINDIIAISSSMECMSQRVDCNRLLKATGSFRKLDANMARGMEPEVRHKPATSS